MTSAAPKWTLLASVSFIGFMIAGAISGVLGAVIAPVMKDLGWSSGATSAMATSFTIGSLATTPLIGMALDRWEVRRVMSLGTVILVLGLIAVSNCRSWPLMIVAFAIAGAGFSACSYLPSTVVVTNAMSHRKSLGMGIMLGAVSAGAAVFSPLVVSMIETLGWRPALQVVTGLVIAMLPLIWLTIRAPMHLDVVRAARERLPSSPVKADLLSLAFALATSGGVLVSLGMLGMYFHVVPLLIHAGYSARSAGLAFGATWLFSGIGSVVLGAIADRFGAQRVLGVALISSAAGTALLLGVGNQVTGAGSVIAFVILWGMPANAFGQLIPVIFAQRFGHKKLGTLVGVQAGISGFAGAIAPIITGVIYDRFLDYQVAIVLSAGAIFLGSMLVAATAAPNSGEPADASLPPAHSINPRRQSRDISCAWRRWVSATQHAWEH